MARREVALPPAFRWLEGQVHYVQKVTATEYSATCPRCGGTVHRNGEWPDRLRIFDDDHKLIWCRQCGHMQFADRANGQKVSPEEFARWRREQIEREEARKRSAERALAHLRDQQIWLRYHEQMTGAGRDYWRRRGIPDGWQDVWFLGWVPQQNIHLPDGRPMLTPSATIPLFDEAGQLLNIKHRLVRVQEAGQKYRYEIAGQGQPPFLANPEREIVGDVIAIEGEIKAAVTFLTLNDSRAVIVGLPGATVSQDVIDRLAKAERITLVMDPGADEQAEALAGRLGKQRCRILVTHAKIDDAILACEASAYDVRCWLRQARAA